MGLRITNAMKTLLGQLGIDITASTLPNLGSESDTAAVAGSAFAQINDLQNKVGLPADTASATGSAFARAKFNKDANDSVAARALVLEAALTSVLTITLDTVIATDVVAVNGVTLTFVAADPGENEVLVGADDEATAINLAAKIDALANITATSDADVVTVTSTVPGVYLAVTTSDTTMVIAPAGTANVMYLLNNLFVEFNALSARVTAIEET